ncbi:MAG: TRAP transporter large permease [Rhodobacteraceae bacterium]|nr:TRAP transporter large permease [Paracoccaceae bacterium]
MTIALIGFAVLIFLAFIGVPLAFASLIVGIAGFAIFRGIEPAFYVASQQVSDLISNFNLIVLPLFILMGEMARHGRMTDALYDLGQAAVGRFRGGLAMATVVSCGLFSTVSGSTIATAATMAKVSLPPMRRYGYGDGLAAGSVAAGGTLGILIPPSVPMVIYAIFAKQDIGKMWIAGILPGILMILTFIIAIMIYVRLFPATLSENAGTEDAAEEKAAPGGALAFLALFLLVIGGIYLGIFTPTEAAAIGAFGAWILAMLRGRMRSLDEYREVFSSAAGISASIFVVASCALVFSQFINISGLPYTLLGFTQWLELSGLQLILMISVICILLGMVFDSLGILVLIVPIFLPALEAQQIDLIWFGVIVIILVEIGLISPPLGVNVFVVKAVDGRIDVMKAFHGAIAFVLAMIVTVGLIILFPGITSVLTSMMR